jgi:Flp pilus assembly protein protease CpaA
VGALKVLVVLMGVLIVGGTVTLVVLLVQRAGGPAAGAAWQTALEQPEGARVGGVAATESGIGIWVQRPDGDRVLMVDPRRGIITGEIRIGR